MNLSDTSIDSSVQSGMLDDGENDIANNLQVNLSVTSSLQSDRIQDARGFGDLVAEKTVLCRKMMHSSNALQNYKQQKQEEQEEQQEEEQAEEEQEKSLLQLLLIQNLGHSTVENGRGGELKELQVKLTK